MRFGDLSAETVAKHWLRTRFEPAKMYPHFLRFEKCHPQILNETLLRRFRTTIRILPALHLHLLPAPYVYLVQDICVPSAQTCGVPDWRYSFGIPAISSKALSEAVEPCGQSSVTGAYSNSRG